MPITPVLILLGAAVLANLALMALIIVPPMLGRASPVARSDEPAVDSERRAAAGGGRRRDHRPGG